MEVVRQFVAIAVRAALVVKLMRANKMMARTDCCTGSTTGIETGNSGRY